MAENEIRESVQKRSIEKKEKIIEKGFELICEKGYYNTNTAEIAKSAGVSTGIVYQYFNDKHDILIEGIKKYASRIFFPMLHIAKDTNINPDNLEMVLKEMIDNFIKSHLLSKEAHSEITAMTHTDEQIADFFKNNEIYMTNSVVEILLNSGFNPENIHEKVHLSIILIDNLCHEIVYHKHEEMNYETMTNLVINTIVNLINS